jgi:hypothetical protein
MADYLGNGCHDVAQEVNVLLALYETFLRNTDRSKKNLVQEFADPSLKKERAKDGREFGEHMFALLQTLGREGRGKELYRHMVV